MTGDDLNEREQKIVFHPLDRNAEIEMTSRNLPHWFQVGATIFVTFRTLDSILREVRLLWQRELEHWLSIRGLPTELAASTVTQRHTHHDQVFELLSAGDRAEFRKMTDRIFHRSLDDCHGVCPFRRPSLADVVGDAIRHSNGDKYDLDRFIVMPNHVHVLVQFRQELGLEFISQSWMRYTARLINKATGQAGPVWQPEPFDHIIHSEAQTTLPIIPSKPISVRANTCIGKRRTIVLNCFLQHWVHNKVSDGILGTNVGAGTRKAVVHCWVEDLEQLRTIVLQRSGS